MNIKSKALVLSLSTVVIVNLTACKALTETADNAKQATSHSGRAADAASESRSEIVEGRVLKKNSSPSTNRREALTAMANAKTFQLKATEAAKYIRAFEFQVFTGRQFETGDYLLRAKRDAMSEFFRSLPEIYNDQDISLIEPTVIKTTESGPDKNIFALAVALHAMGVAQESLKNNNPNPGDEYKSMLELIKTALVSIAKYEDNEIGFSDLKQYEVLVFENKEAAINLLRARMNMYMILALGDISPIKIKASHALRKLPIWFFTCKFSRLNVANQKKVNSYLNQAREMSDFLNKTVDQGRGNLSQEVIDYYEDMAVPSTPKSFPHQDAELEWVEFGENLSSFFDSTGQYLVAL